MPDNDRPGEEIWLDDELLVEHFDWVRARHARSSGWESVPDADDEGTENELLKDVRRRLR